MGHLQVKFGGHDSTNTPYLTGPKVPTFGQFFVILSAAKQSSAKWHCVAWRLPRRCAPRNDGWRLTLPRRSEGEARGYLHTAECHAAGDCRVAALLAMTFI